MRKELEVVDKRLARFTPALDAETEDATLPLRQILLRQRVTGVARQARVIDPGDLGMGDQPVGDRQGVLAMALHPQGQRLKALEQQKGVEGTKRRAEVAQTLNAGFDNVGKTAEALGIDQAVVARVRLSEFGVAPVRPIKLAAIHNHAAEAGAVAADVLSGRVNNDVGPVLKRLPEIRRHGGRVNDDDDARRVGDSGDLLQIKHIELRVADQFEEKGFGAPINRLAEPVEVAAIHKARGNAELGQRVAEKVVGAAVEVGRGDQIIAGACQIEDRQRFGSLPGGESQRTHATFEGGNALLEDIRRGVHNPGINVPKLLQTKEPGGVVGVPELIRGSLVNRHGPCASRRVRRLPAVEGQGLEAGELWVARHTSVLLVDNGEQTKNPHRWVMRADTGDS